MDSSPPSLEASASTTTRPHKPRFALRWAIAILGLLFLIFTVVLILPEGSNRDFTWLTPAQMQQNMKPGPLTLLKSKVRNLLGPLMRYYHRNRPLITISSSIMKVSDTAAAQTALGAPIQTNADGTRAWILSAAELADLQRQLKTNPGVSNLMSPRIQTGDGFGGQMTMGRAVSLAPGVSTNVGTVIDILARSSRGLVNLLLAVSSTDLASPQTSSQIVIKTNFSVACRVLVPNAGAVVISCGQPSPDTPANCWLIVSPVLVDARGRPFKP